MGPLVEVRETDAAVPAAEMTALRWIFALALIPGLAAMAVLALRVREIAPAPSNGAGEGDEKLRRRLPARFHAFVGIAALFALGNSSDMFLLLYGWMMLDLSLPAVLLLWVALHLSKIVFSIPGGALSDRFGRRPLIISGWIMYAFIYLGMAAIGEGSAWLFCILFVGYGFYYGMTEGAERALVADFTESRDRGTAYGLYHGVVGLAALPASLLFGVFWTAIGPRFAFGIGAGLALLAAVLLAWLLAATGPGAKHPGVR
jgi:MFS family permease